MFLKEKNCRLEEKSPMVEIKSEGGDKSSRNTRKLAHPRGIVHQAPHPEVKWADGGIRWGQSLAGRKPRREELPPDVNLCQYCSAKCCRYLAIQIDEPTTARQFDYLVWFLLHERVAVFMERKRWFVLFRTTCKELLHDGRCGIYEERPKICRRYSTKRCEYEDDWVYEKLFELPEQVLEYAEVMLAQPGVVKRTARKSSRPKVSGNKSRL